LFFNGVHEVASLSYTDSFLISPILFLGIIHLFFFNGVHEVAALCFTDFVLMTSIFLFLGISPIFWKLQANNV